MINLFTFKIMEKMIVRFTALRSIRTQKRKGRNIRQMTRTIGALLSSMTNSIVV